MKKPLLLFSICLPLSLTNISAQVQAGITDNLSQNNNNAAETVNIFTFQPPFGEFDNIAEDSLDLNRDGVFDVRFGCNSCNTFDCDGGTVYVSDALTNLAFMVDSNQNIRQLNTGEVIDAGQQWATAGNSILISKVAGFGGYMESGGWLAAPEGYAGVRLLSGQDTLYGWLKILATVNANTGSTSLKILQWAIQESGTASPHVVVGASSGLVPCSNVSQLNLGPPIPMGTNTILADSLDLNGDNILDVAMVVSASNIAGDVKSSVSWKGLHSGFNSVFGPDGVKRFQEGVTIGLNNEWEVTAADGDVFVSAALVNNTVQLTGEWQGNSQGYAGFRLVTPNADTLLGWLYLKALALPGGYASLTILDCAIMHDPSLKPWAETNITPVKSYYCPGDTVVFEAVTVGADAFAWHFWDGTTEAATTATRIIPDSSVTAIFTSTNQNGTVERPIDIAITPLTLAVGPALLSCFHTSDTLLASTNIPADIFWVTGNDTIFGPTTIIHFPAQTMVFAKDEYGCTVSEAVEIQIDIDIPVVNILYDEDNHLLIAQSPTPGATFMWTTNIGGTEPVFNDSVFINQSGVYSVLTTAPNGCSSVGFISIVITSAPEPLAGMVELLPNPVGDLLQINNLSASGIRLQMLDAAGNRRLTEREVPAGASISLDVTALASGLYWVAGFDAAGNRLVSKRFVKE